MFAGFVDNILLEGIPIHFREIVQKQNEFLRAMEHALLSKGTLYYLVCSCTCRYRLLLKYVVIILVAKECRNHSRWQF